MPASEPIDPHLDETTSARVHALWDELADFDAGEIEAARNHLLAGICALIEARNASWVGAVRMGDPQPGDPARGWRPRAVRQLHATRLSERMIRQQSAMLETGQVDETVIANVAGAGTYRVSLLVDLVPEDWFAGDYYKIFYLGAGNRDVIWAGIPVNEDAEVYFGFLRGPDQPMFAPAERDIVAFALRGLRWFHHRQLLGEGLGIASAPLTAQERLVLRGLLSGLSEREISRAHGHSPHTTHDHVKHIFRKFGVGSRAALTALWLGRPKA